MVEGKLLLPRLSPLGNVRLTSLKHLGSSGPYHLKIRATKGPFDIEKIGDPASAAYPALWAHDAKRETQMTVQPDTQGRIRQGWERKAREIWATASRLHFNLDFRLNSQPLAACRTSEPTIGGRAWPTFKLHDELWELPILLWANTTLGLVAFWWIGSRQQQGRAVLTIKRLPKLVTLDPQELTCAQLDVAADIFDLFRERTFLPANEAYRDATRRALDEAVLVDLLGLHQKEVMSSLAVLRDQWCREPSVHGGKTSQPIE